MRISSNNAIALIDANNFYASCEQNINPNLRNKPVVILSNNDAVSYTHLRAHET